MDPKNTNPKIDGAVFITTETLSPKELQLIAQLRTNFRWGEVTIMMQDGIPQQIIKTVVRQKL